MRKTFLAFAISCLFFGCSSQKVEYELPEPIDFMPALELFTPMNLPSGENGIKCWKSTGVENIEKDIQQKQIDFSFKSPESKIAILKKARVEDSNYLLISEDNQKAVWIKY
jgi:hypothetical protein